MDPFLPLPPLNLSLGFGAGPAVSGATGTFSFQDGAFQVGGQGNSAITPQSVTSAPTPNAHLPYGYSTPSLAGSSGLPAWALIGAALLCVLLLRHR